VGRAVQKDDCNFISLSSIHRESRNFVSRIIRDSGVNPSDCYQCGKCSAGCPVAFAMDYMPRQIIRMLQLGMIKEVLSSRTIWLCAGCAACYARCPHNVDLPRLMETLRMEARESGLVAEKKVRIFEDLFLRSVERYGRVFETGLIIGFNIKSGQFLKDAMLGPVMLAKGKISLLPHKIKDGGAVRRIFAKVREMEGE